jgi:hypothetical protein
MSTSAILFSSHLLDEVVLERLFRLCDEVPANHRVVFFYDEAKLSAERVRQAIDSRAGQLEHGNDLWSRYKRGNLYATAKIPGNEDGMLLHAFHRLEGFDYYWYLEYDVVFSGHWGEFFRAFSDNRADMLGTNISRYPEIPHWPLWKSIEVPPELAHSKERWLRSFNPILRLSRTAMQTLTSQYASGVWAGHSEAIMATVLSYQGLTLEDFGGEGEFVPAGRECRYYRSSRLENSLAPGTFIFRPAMMQPGSEPNKLWHPVKDPKHRTWDYENLFTKLRQFYWSKMKR